MALPGRGRNNAAQGREARPGKTNEQVSFYPEGVAQARSSDKDVLAGMRRSPCAPSGRPQAVRTIPVLPSTIMWNPFRVRDVFGLSFRRVRAARSWALLFNPAGYSRCAL